MTKLRNIEQARSQDFAQGGGGGGGASKVPLPERSKGSFSSVERAPFLSADLHRGPLNVHGALWSFREGLVALRTSKLSENCASRGLVGLFGALRAPKRALLASRGGGAAAPAAPPLATCLI